MVIVDRERSGGQQEGKPKSRSNWDEIPDRGAAYRHRPLQLNGAETRPSASSQWKLSVKRGEKPTMPRSPREGHDVHLLADWRSSAQIRVAQVGLPATRGSDWARFSAVGPRLGSVRRDLWDLHSYGEHMIGSNCRSCSKHVPLNLLWELSVCLAFLCQIGRGGTGRWVAGWIWGPGLRPHCSETSFQGPLPHRSYSLFSINTDGCQLTRCRKRPAAVRFCKVFQHYCNQVCLP